MCMQLGATFDAECAFHRETKVLLVPSSYFY